MSPRPALASLLLAAACTSLAAQTAPAAAPVNPAESTRAAAPPVDVLPRSAAEPVAEQVVIDTDGARIEEQHLRGEVRSIHVQPKHGGPAYEILPANGGRDLTNSHGNSRGNAGQRVWSVLRF